MAGEAVWAVRWRDGALELLDQRVLPEREAVVRLDTAAGTADAIRAMVVRGAPAIGVAAAYGVVLAVEEAYRADPERWREAIEPDLERLAGARPTAVNLGWAIRRMRDRLGRIDGDPREAALAEARAIHDEDVAANRRIGALGAALIRERCDVLTHCNAGALATGGYGTALGVIRSAHAEGRVRSVYADETRPWLQGARLTAWELLRDGIPVSLIADSAAAFVLGQGEVGAVVVGADRVAANGDVANKIGTLALAVSARYHQVPFIVAAPTSTIDRACPTGADIPIERRAEDELLELAGRRFAAPGAGAWNPVFDVTPATLVDYLVTERGVVQGPDRNRIESLLDG